MLSVYKPPTAEEIGYDEATLCGTICTNTDRDGMFNIVNKLMRTPNYDIQSITEERYKKKYLKYKNKYISLKNKLI